MNTQDKLAEALRVAREWLRGDKWRNSTIDKHKSWEAMMRGIDATLAEYDAHAAEAEQAQAQAQSGEWVQKAIVDAKGDIEYVHVRIFNAMKARAEEAEAMFAAATQQAAEPVYQYQATPDSWVDCDYDLYNASGDPKRILYTHPAPSDAERLAEALHSIGERLSSVLCDPFGEVVVRGSDDDRQIIAQALKDLGELAAHSAQAQPPTASVPDGFVMVRREPTQAMVEAICKIKLARLEALRTGHEAGSGIVAAVQEEWEAMLAAQESRNG